MGDSTYTLRIDYLGSEYTPDGEVQYATFQGFVAAEGLQGDVDFEVTDIQIRAFVKDLEALYERFAPDPEMKTGWGSNVTFNLKFSRLNMQGDVMLVCELRQSSVADEFNSVKTYSIVELHHVTQVSGFFRAVMSGPETPDSLFARRKM